MNLVNLLICSILNGSTILAQAQTTWYCPVEIMPELVTGGGSAAIAAAIQQQLVYPAEAVQVQARVAGRVFISFTITTEGLVKDVRVVKGLRPDCDAAALRAVRLLPRFKPGQQSGKPVACKYTVPVTFSLSHKLQRTQ